MNAAIKIRSRIPSLEGVFWNLGKGKWEVVATVKGRKHSAYFLKLQDALWVSRRIRKAEVTTPKESYPSTTTESGRVQSNKEENFKGSGDSQPTEVRK